jgi:sigma-54 dependent transcriptional regulator, acetoin dehydrogenase operon transcriptional activator AcoR
MIMSELLNIKDTVQKFAEVLKEVIKFDVEIVDRSLLRIAGTGVFEAEKGEYVEEGNIYRLVLKTKEMVLVENPRENILCQGCKRIEQCIEKYEISYPILLEGQVIGVIGFLCYSEEQKQYFLSNRESFIKFLDQISGLIALKAKSNNENLKLSEMLMILESVINKVSDCVLLVNSKNELVDYNAAGAKFLNYNSNSKIEFIKPKLNDDKYAFTVTVNGTLLRVFGELNEVESTDGSYKIAIFQEVADTDYKNGHQVLNEIIGESIYIKELKERVKKVSRNSSTVLITGESGTGKELIARAIHSLSERSSMPFVAINCGAIPDTLLESELFGYEKGSFSGADPRGKIGKFEIANGGTIFLDEIADMPLYMQVKMLRVLQEKTVTRIGAHQPKKVDIRIIAATNKNLTQMVKEKTFREDLYYRLNVIPVYSYPLRERKDDIKLLTQYFLNKYQAHFQRKGIIVDKSVWDIFYEYDWPGNVRELENAVEFTIAMIDNNNRIDRSSLPKSIRENRYSSVEPVDDYNLKKLERETIDKVMEICGDTTEGKLRASRMLGIGVATLYRKLK